MGVYCTPTFNPKYWQNSIANVPAVYWKISNQLWYTVVQLFPSVVFEYVCISVGLYSLTLDWVNSLVLAGVQIYPPNQNGSEISLLYWKVVKILTYAHNFLLFFLFCESVDIIKTVVSIFMHLLHSCCALVLVIHILLHFIQGLLCLLFCF